MYVVDKCSETKKKYLPLARALQWFCSFFSCPYNFCCFFFFVVLFTIVIRNFLVEKILKLSRASSKERKTRNVLSSHLLNTSAARFYNKFMFSIDLNSTNKKRKIKNPKTQIKIQSCCVFQITINPTINNWNYSSKNREMEKFLLPFFIS